MSDLLEAALVPYRFTRCRVLPIFGASGVFIPVPRFIWRWSLVLPLVSISRSGFSTPWIETEPSSPSCLRANSPSASTDSQPHWTSWMARNYFLGPSCVLVPVSSSKAHDCHLLGPGLCFLTGCHIHLGRYFDTTVSMEEDTILLWCRLYNLVCGTMVTKHWSRVLLWVLSLVVVLLEGL